MTSSASYFVPALNQWVQAEKTGTGVAKIVRCGEVHDNETGRPCRQPAAVVLVNTISRETSPSCDKHASEASREWEVQS